MPRTMWRGQVSFGLVNIPVRMVSAQRTQRVRFHQLDAESGERIRQKRVREDTGEEVSFEQIVKGYEIAPDTYVRVTPEELEALDPDASRTIDIAEFVKLEEIQPYYLDRSYWLVPDTGADKAYALLAKAMADSDTVAIARFVMREREYLAAIRPVGEGLALTTMYYHDEVTEADEIEGVPHIEDVKLDDREVKMAQQLISGLTAAFEPDEFEDQHRQRVLDLIERKAAGEQVEMPKGKRATATTGDDLVRALEESLAQVS